METNYVWVFGCVFVYGGVSVRVKTNGTKFTVSPPNQNQTKNKKNQIKIKEMPENK